MAIASRYIGGVPYGPGRAVARYPNAASVGALPGVVGFPAVNPGAYPQGGLVTAGADAASTATPAAGGDNMLASLLLGALSYGPDVYNYLDKQFAEDPQAQEGAASTGGAGPNITALGDRMFSTGQDVAMARALDQAGITSGPATEWIGNGGNYTGAFEPGTLQAVPGGAERILDAPMGDPAFAVDPMSFYGVDPATLDGTSGAIDGLGSAAGATNWAGIPLEAVQVGDVGLGSVGGVDIANSLAYAPAAVFAQGTPAFAKRGGELGGQIGSALGGVLGGVIGGPWGAAAGTIAGGAIGGQIGPNPTIGGNFSSIGTFDGSGNLNWGNAGGDNGANANDATSFANWFAPSLMQQAAQQGLGFNPNMTGAQIRVGGYDNPSRRGYAQGGYFYDLTSAGGGFGGDPDRYALRSSDMFNNNAFGPDQANAFTTNVLADLAARGVFTQGGQPGPDQGYLTGTLGANYGWYGAPGDLYSQIEYGGQGGFNDILQGRRNAIEGWVNQNQAQQQANAGAQTVLGAAYDPLNSYDPGAGWAQMGQDVANGGQAPVNWMTDPAAMAAANWGVGVPGGGGPVQADGGA